MDDYTNEFKEIMKKYMKSVRKNKKTKYNLHEIIQQRNKQAILAMDDDDILREGIEVISGGTSDVKAIHTRIKYQQLSDQKNNKTKFHKRNLLKILEDPFATDEEQFKNLHYVSPIKSPLKNKSSKTNMNIFEFLPTLSTPNNIHHNNETFNELNEAIINSRSLRKKMSSIISQTISTTPLNNNKKSPINDNYVLSLSSINSDSDRIAVFEKKNEFAEQYFKNLDRLSKNKSIKEYFEKKKRNEKNKELYQKIHDFEENILNEQKFSKKVFEEHQKKANIIKNKYKKFFEVYH